MTNFSHNFHIFFFKIRVKRKFLEYTTTERILTHRQREREEREERERESEKTGFCIDRGEEVIWILIKESRLVLCFVFIIYYLLREGGIDSAYF